MLQWITGFLAERTIDSPRVCAELLLSHVIGCERTRLYMEVDRPASPTELARLRELVKRAGQHEPVQYLVGETWFHARPFHVDRSTLIPRPATETLVELAVQWARERGGPVRMLDVCTGSGCVAISVVAALVTPRRGTTEPPVSPMEATAVASDLVPAAIDLALRNATRHGLQARIEFRTGDLFEIGGEQLQYYRYVGRSKDLVIRGGMNISSEEIEGLLAACPGVQEVAVVGVPDRILGEKLCACVVSAPGQRVSLDDLVQFLRGQQRVAAYKLPEYLLQVDALPRNPVGKILKRELREQARALAPETV